MMIVNKLLFHAARLVLPYFLIFFGIFHNEVWGFTVAFSLFIFVMRLLFFVTYLLLTCCSFVARLLLNCYFFVIFLLFCLEVFI